MSVGQVERPETLDVRARVPRRRPDVQGLRALAVLAVVAYHAGIPLRGGFVGVDVFFVISGYVITGLLVREAGANRRIRFGHFYRRRVRRLAPALCLMGVVTLGLVAVLYSPVGPDQSAAAKAAVAAALLSANAYFFSSTGGYFQPDANANPFLHTWSLSVEEQFYLAFPAFLALLLVCGRRLGEKNARRLVLTGFGVLGAASFLLCVACTLGWIDLGQFTTRYADPDAQLRKFAFFGTPARGWEFLVGGVLVFLAPIRTRAVAVRAVGLLLVAASVLLLRDGANFPGYVVALPVVGTALVLAAPGERPDAVHGVLGSRPMTWLGDRSYSWYLWHWPMILFAGVLWPALAWVKPVAAVAALVVAAAAYRYVEYPIHRGRWPASRRAMNGVVVLSLVALPAAGVGVWRLAEAGWGNARIQAVRADVTPAHADIASGCARATALGSPDRPTCTWTVPRPRGTILLIGDSNAGHFTEPFVAAAASLGYDATIATNGGCPMALTPRPLSSTCTEFVEGSIDEIVSHPDAYAGIVISNASAAYLGGENRALFGDTDAGVVAAWSATIDRTVRQLRRVAPVLVVGAVPQYLDLPSCFVPNIWRSRPPSCGRLPTNSRALEFRQRVIDDERRTVLADGAQYFDTADVLCRPDLGCSALLRGMPVYRDGAHLSVNGSMHLEPGLRRAIGTLVGAG